RQRVSVTIAIAAHHGGYAWMLTATAKRRAGRLGAGTPAAIRPFFLRGERNLPDAQVEKAQIIQGRRQPRPPRCGAYGLRRSAAQGTTKLVAGGQRPGPRRFEQRPWRQRWRRHERIGSRERRGCATKTVAASRGSIALSASPLLQRPQPVHDRLRRL